MSTGWKETAKALSDYRDASLAKVQPPLTWPNDEAIPLSSQGLPAELLTPREYDLTTNYTAIELLSPLRDRSLKAEELTRAFLRRAAIAQYATNCLTELMWDEAIERAKYLDLMKEPLGPLHGLPISVKEHQGMHMYDKNLNCGYTAWAENKSPFSPLKQILWDAGWALIGMLGSMLGIGGDIGGSVRVPAGQNGLYGFKPTAKRLGTNSAGLDAANSTPSHTPMANFLARHFDVHWVAYWCGLPELEALSAGKFKENLKQVKWPTSDCSRIFEHVYEDITDHSAEYELQKAVEDKSMLHLADLHNMEDYAIPSEFAFNLIDRIMAEQKKAEGQRDETQEMLQSSQKALQEAKDEISRIRLGAQDQQEKNRVALQIAEIDLTTARNETVQVRQEVDRQRVASQKILQIAR